MDAIQVYQWLGLERPIYHEIRSQLNITLALAQELDNIYCRSVGPGGFGFRWFKKHFVRLMKRSNHRKE